MGTKVLQKNDIRKCVCHIFSFFYTNRQLLHALVKIDRVKVHTLCFYVSQTVLHVRIDLFGLLIA